ncbi:Endoribonuclease YbeY [compost metagenome]
MNIQIVNQAKEAVPRKFVQTWGELLSKELIKRKEVAKEFKDVELTLVFLDPRPAKKINKEFRGKDYATDVLSFESMTPDSLGELVLCPSVLKKQSKEHGLTYKVELGYMLLHGVLHLLGYDHETSEEDAKEMFGLQDEIFEVLLKKLKA